jgi:hypothetical protein
VEILEEPSKAHSAAPMVYLRQSTIVPLIAKCPTLDYHLHFAQESFYALSTEARCGPQTEDVRLFGDYCLAQGGMA